MKPIIRRFSPSLLIAVFAISMLNLALANSAGAAKKDKEKYSGIFAPYPEFEKAKGGGKIWRAEGQDLAGFNKVMIQDIVFQFKERSKGSYVHPADLSMLEDYTRDALKDQLGKRFPLVDEADTHTIVLRIAFTHLVPADIDLFRDMHMRTRPRSRMNDWALGYGIGVGEVGVEVEVLNGADNERMMLFIDDQVGGRIQVDWDYDDPEYDHVRGAIYEWADRLDDALTKANKEKKK